MRRRQQVRALVGADGAEAIEAMVRSVAQPGQGMLAAAAGLLTTLIGASTVFAELQGALNRIWGARPGAEGGGAVGPVAGAARSLGWCGAGFLLLVSLVASAALAAFSRWWGRYFRRRRRCSGAGILVSFGADTVVFAVIYKVLPDTPAWSGET